MYLTYNDYLLYINKQIQKPIAKIEWLRVDETVESTITSDILGGNLSISRNNGVRRTCSFTLKNEPNLLPDIYGIWVKKKFKLWLGVIDDNGNEFFLPQGVFVLTNPNYNSEPSGSTVTINGTDKFCLLNGEMGGILKDIYQINSGTNVNNSITTILTAFGDPKPPIMDLTSQTFPYTIRKGQDDNIGELLKEIAKISSRNIY